MMNEIQRAAVIGAGTMGAAIAAHLANAGIRVILLDIVPRELDPAEIKAGLTLSDPRVRNRIVKQGLELSSEISTGQFFHGGPGRACRDWQSGG